MKTERVDVAVIGMGVGGEEVAGRLADAGLTVAGIEAELVGGECPYWACIPSKMMIRAANTLTEARRVPGLAGSATVSPDWEPVARRIREEATDDWEDRVAVERFAGKGGLFVRGRGHIEGPGVVTVEGRRLETTRGIVIATGTVPAIPPIDGLADVDYWTNREAIATKELPGSLVVLGGGAVGLELAQVFSRFGVAVRIVEMLDRLLPGEELEASELIADVLRSEGIEVRTGIGVRSVHRDGDRTVVELEDGTAVDADRLLVATGRRADLRSLGLGTVGIDEEAPYVAVDARLRAADGVWAVGDVTGVGAFTHVAVHQGRIAAADILGDAVASADYRALPRVTFTDPEVGSVGLTEAAAREAGFDVRTGIAKLPASARGWIHKAGNEGLIKLVEDAHRGVLVGATSVGPTGGEVLSMLTLAVHAEVPTSELRRMIYAYPTFHRAIEDALRDLQAG